MDIIPRVKLLAWRSCLEALPTQLGLSSRVPSINATCGLCGDVDESGLHALANCGIGKLVWEASGLPHDLPRGCTRVADWWVYMFDVLEQEQVCFFVTLCGAIWGARCKALMEGESAVPSSIVAYAHKTCHDTFDALRRERQKAGGEVALPSKWAAPERGWLKCNADAGRLGEVGSGLGTVGRD